MSLFSHRSEADRLDESIARNQAIIARLLMEQEQINRSLAYHHAELDWLYRCKTFIAGSDSHNARAIANGSVSLTESGRPLADGPIQPHPNVLSQSEENCGLV
jgi:hypothetical protein